MASSVNKVILVGNLGKDPEQRTTSNGRAVTSFSIATSEKWTDQSGQTQEKTNWHNIVVWGKQAESCARYLAKGRRVYVEGKIENRSYEDKEGVTRYVTDIVARDVIFLDARGGESSESHERPAQQNTPSARPTPNKNQPPQRDENWNPPPPSFGQDDDIPF